MTPDTRVADFMARIRQRAAEQERAAMRPLATAGHSTPLAPPAAPAWLEPNTRPIEDEQPCGFVKSMIRRQNGELKQPLFRSIHGKKAA